MSSPSVSPGTLPDRSTFAGVLAALTGAAAKPTPAQRQSAPAWLDDLDDDVALLSYERALQAHRGSGMGSRVVPVPQSELAQAAEGPTPRPTPNSPSGGLASPSADGRKRASVTIRMSVAECEQLQRRAAEAGLTVSAYLRSCAFEVDSLRTEVKQALADLRAAQLAAREAVPPHRRWWLRLLGRAAVPQAA